MVWTWEDEQIWQEWSEIAEDPWWGYAEDIEPHYCDFPLCPCDANQNRLLADSREYYQRDRDEEIRRGLPIGWL